MTIKRGCLFEVLEFDHVPIVAVGVCGVVDDMQKEAESEEIEHIEFRDEIKYWMKQ
jgi:hypothetical protein